MPGDLASPVLMATRITGVLFRQIAARNVTECRQNKQKELLIQKWILRETVQQKNLGILYTVVFA
jgi:hypothetical protein